MYDSGDEASYAKQLELQRKAIDPRYRVIKIERQPRFILQRKPNQITYKADFRVWYADGHIEVVDVKGMKTDIFKLKIKMMKEKYPEIEIILIKLRRR
jgi:hypothetical protein